MSNLESADNKLIMVGGKGGVGKTTCSAAIAVHWQSYGHRMNLIEVPLLADEVKGIKRIREISDILFSQNRSLNPEKSSS